MKEAIEIVQEMLDRGPASPAAGFDEGYYTALEEVLDALKV